MKPAHILIPIATFAVGYAVAWTVKPSAPLPATADASVQTRATPRAGDRVKPTRNPADPGITERLDQLLGKAPYQMSPQDAHDLDKQDYPRLLEALAKRGAGMTGLDDEQKMLMRELVLDWYQASPDAALSWVRGLESENDRRTLLSEMMASLFKKDWKEGVAFAEQYGVAEGQALEMPDAMFPLLEKLDASELLRVLNAFPSPLGARGINLDFSHAPPDFDFRQVLDGLATRKVPGKFLAYVPQGLASEWAKRDFESALQWARSGKGDVFNSPGDVVKTIAATGNADEVAALTVQMMNTQLSPYVDYDMAWRVLDAHPTPELVRSFLKQEPGKRQEHLSNLLAFSLWRNGSMNEGLRETLLSQMTAAERVAAFQSEAVGKSRNSVSKSKSLPSALLRLGHTQQEIDQMMFAGSLPK